MARNCKLRYAAQTQYQIEEREFGHGGDYPTSKSGKLVTSTSPFRRNNLTGQHFKEPAFSTAKRDTHSYSRLVAAFITLALSGGVLASNLIAHEKSRFENGAKALLPPNPARLPYVELPSPVDLPRRESAQSSHELCSIHH
jgi:hypothetical protein